MTIFYAPVIPILILGLIYIVIIEKKGIPVWMESISDYSDVWSYHNHTALYLEKT